MLLCSAALPCASAQQAVEAQRVDAAWILSKLARPAPMRTSFVEVRDSKLLKSPLRLSGEYLRPRADTLVREVHAPYREITTIVTAAGGPGEVSIQRGERKRSYSLARVPDLASLQASFGAMLAGDQAALERDFRLTPQGTRTQWTLAMAPRQAALATRVKQITLYGRGTELRCIETVPVKGSEIQQTLLATAARAAIADPAVATVPLCRGEAD